MAAPIMNKPKMIGKVPVTPKSMELTTVDEPLVPPSAEAFAEMTAGVIQPHKPPVPTPKPIAARSIPAFDYAAFKAAHKKKVAKPSPLFLLLTGMRGSAKSWSLGSAPGDMLLFCSRQEHHAAQSATACNASLKSPFMVAPIWIDVDDEGNYIEAPEKVWNRISDKLEGLIQLEHPADLFPFVAIDSLNSLERYTIKRDNVLKATQFQKSQEATANLVELVVGKLLRLREKGVNIIVTMASEVKEKADGSLSLTPFLTGYRAADEIIGSFPDIAVCTCLTDPTGEEKPQYVFQFNNAEGSKSGKKFTGEAATTTFIPRLQSIPRNLLPDCMESNITTLIDFIATTFKQMSEETPV